jgi:hypothetical protein
MNASRALHMLVLIFDYHDARPKVGLNRVKSFGCCSTTTTNDNKRPAHTNHHHIHWNRGACFSLYDALTLMLVDALLFVSIVRAQQQYLTTFAH